MVDQEQMGDNFIDKGKSIVRAAPESFKSAKAKLFILPFGRLQPLERAKAGFEASPARLLD